MRNTDNLIPSNGKLITLLPAKTITTALTDDVTTAVQTGIQGARYLGFEGIFVFGSGGATVKAWIQTSFDGGTTWFDIACLAFTTASLKKVGGVSTNIAAAAPATPTDGALADNTINNGLLGDRIRVKLTTTSTYAGSTTLAIYAIAKG